MKYILFVLILISSLSNAQITLSNGEVFSRTSESLERLITVTAKKITRLRTLSETSVSNIDGNEVKNLYEDIQLVTTYKDNKGYFIPDHNQVALVDFLAKKKQFYLTHLPKTIQPKAKTVESTSKSTIALDDLWSQEKSNLQQKQNREKEEKKRNEIQNAEQRKKFQKEMRVKAKACSNTKTLSSEERMHISKEYFVSYSSIKLLKTNYSPIFGCQFIVDTPKGVKNLYFSNYGGINELLSD